MNEQQPQPKRSTSKLVVAAAAVVAVIGIVWFVNRDDAGGSSMSRAFCNDLDDGLTMLNLWPREMDPEDFANDAWGYVATTCPEHYEPNREYFDGWGLPAIEG